MRWLRHLGSPLGCNYQHVIWDCLYFHHVEHGRLLLRGDCEEKSALFTYEEISHRSPILNNLRGFEMIIDVWGPGVLLFLYWCCQLHFQDTIKIVSPRTSASDLFAVSYLFSNFDFLSFSSGEGEQDGSGDVWTEDLEAVQEHFQAMAGKPGHHHWYSNLLSK